MIASDCFFCGWVVSRGMVSHGIFWVFSDGKNVVLQIHILALKFGPCLYHSPTSVLSQCTILLTSMWLTCIYLLVLISGVRHALPPNNLPQIH